MNGKIFAQTLLSVVLSLGIATPAITQAGPKILKKEALIKKRLLEVNIKEVGLGKNESVKIKARANSKIIDACMNHGGQWPMADQYQVSEGPVEREQEVTSSKNGSVEVKLLLTPAEPEFPLVCQKPWTKEVACESWTDVEAEDATNGITEPVAERLVEIYYPLPECDELLAP